MDMSGHFIEIGNSPFHVVWLVVGIMDLQLLFLFVCMLIFDSKFSIISPICISWMHVNLIIGSSSGDRKQSISYGLACGWNYGSAVFIVVCVHAC